MFNSFPLPKPDAGGGGVFKSIQHGTSSLPGTSMTATISPIVPANSIVMITILPNASSIAISTYLTSAEITDATTLTFTKQTASGVTVSIAWVVYEFFGVKSKQTGIKTTALTSDTVTINAVNSLKYILAASHISSSGIADAAQGLLKCDLTNSTTITLTQTNAINKVAYWQVIEFY